jgi:hypothetical protein
VTNRETATSARLTPETLENSEIRLRPTIAKVLVVLCEEDEIEGALTTPRRSRRLDLESERVRSWRDIQIFVGDEQRDGEFSAADSRDSEEF